jgi:molecular chaperone GrpE
MSNKHKPHSDGKEQHGQARSDHHHDHDDHAPEPIELTPADEAHPEAANESTQPEETVETLRAQLANKDREIAELKDKYLRALADFENSRKRIRQQSEESVRLQRESLLRDLLPIVDNLERAVEAAQGGGNGKPIVEGVQMVLASLLDYLRVQGVTPIEAKGRIFDPRLHEAVDHVESPHHEPNTVVNEMHRGYAAGDRILRPARVSVSKGRGDGGGDPERKQGEE